VAVEHHAGAHAHDTHGRALGFPLPGLADVGEDVVTRRCVLVDRVGAVPVVPDGRRRHQRVRARLRRLDACDQVAGADLARVLDAAQAFGVPALGDVLAGEVDDGVTAVECLGRRRTLHRVPADVATAAAEHGDLVAASAELLDQERADAAGASGDGDPHSAPNSCVSPGA
jgi:hypothetical protein